MSEALIRIQNLEFSYDQKPLLQIPDWQLQSEERIFLKGPSGSGKTTFLEIISGILQAQKGHYYFQSQDFAALSSQKRDEVRKQSMSLIFQSFNLVPYLTVQENILLPFWLGYKDTRTALELQQELQTGLQQLGLSGIEDRKVTELSQGQQQRVAALRAFMKRPQLLLADEPTSSLDTEHRTAFIEALFQMAKLNKTALIFVSHDPALESHFDRVCDIREWRAL